MAATATAMIKWWNWSFVFGFSKWKAKLNATTTKLYVNAEFHLHLYVRKEHEFMKSSMNASPNLAPPQLRDVLFSAVLSNGGEKNINNTDIFKLSKPMWYESSVSWFGHNSQNENPNWINCKCQNDSHIFMENYFFIHMNFSFTWFLWWTLKHAKYPHLNLVFFFALRVWTFNARLNERQTHYTHQGRRRERERKKSCNYNERKAMEKNNKQIHIRACKRKKIIVFHFGWALLGLLPFTFLSLLLYS